MKFHCPTGDDYIIEPNTQSMLKINLQVFQALVYGNANRLHRKVMIVTNKEEQIPRNSIFGNIGKVLLTHDKASKQEI